MRSVDISEILFFRKCHQIFEYLFAVLPKYIVNAYNNLNYNYDDNVGLKIEILKTIIKTAYSESNATVNSPFYIYIPVDFKISFYTNENTGEYYDSLPVNIKFVKDNDEETPIVNPDLFNDAENVSEEIPEGDFLTDEERTSLIEDGIVPQEEIVEVVEEAIIL